MRSPVRDESGDTLVEIIFALVIIGLVVGALFAAITTNANASKAQRDFVSADTVLRNAAELTKSAVRDLCVNNPTYSVNYSGLANAGITPPPNQNNVPCPPSTEPTPTQLTPVTLTVTWPGHTESLDVDVRTP